MNTATLHAGRLARLFCLCLTLLAALGAAAHSQTLDIYDDNGGSPYTGNWSNIVVHTTQPVTIDGATVTGSGDLITGVGGANVTIRNTRGYGTPPGNNVQQGRFVYFYQASRVTVENCYTEHTAGIRVVDNGSRTTSYVRIRYNQAVDVDNRYGNGSGGYQDRVDQGNLGNWIQLNQLQGVDAEIAWNQEINYPYESYVEDSISTYASSGTSGNYINVHDNYIQGGYLPDPTNGIEANGNRYTGTGINLGDQAAYTNGAGNYIVCQYVNVHDNQIVGYGSHGISLLCGNAQNVYNNRVVASGYLQSGASFGYSAEGILGRNDTQDSQWNVGTPNHVNDNTVGYYSTWFGYEQNFNDLTGQGVWNWGNDHRGDLPNTITLDTEANEYNNIWLPKVSNNGITIGPGQCLTGAYFGNTTLSGTPKTRTDKTVNFTWAGSPITGVSSSNYSIRWTGYVRPQYSQTYTFYTNADNGVRLWVNGVMLVNQWHTGGTTQYSGTITLTAKKLYSIRLEHYHVSGAGTVQLSWSSPSRSKQIIPDNLTYPN